MDTITMNKEAMDLKESAEENMEGLEKKREGKMYLYSNLKTEV